MSSYLDDLFSGKPELMSVAETAELLGMTKQGVYHWLRAGSLPGYKLASTWFIVRDELKDTIATGANVRVKQSADTQEHDEGD